MVEKFYDTATKEQIESFELAFAKEDASPTAEKLAREMLIESGALEAANKKLDNLIATMEETIKRLSISDDSKAKLTELMNMCVKRDY